MHIIRSDVWQMIQRSRRASLVWAYRWAALREPCWHFRRKMSSASASGWNVWSASAIVKAVASLQLTKRWQRWQVAVEIGRGYHSNRIVRRGDRCHGINCRCHLIYWFSAINKYDAPLVDGFSVMQSLVVTRSLTVYSVNNVISSEHQYVGSRTPLYLRTCCCTASGWQVQHPFLVPMSHDTLEVIANCQYLIIIVM